MASQRLLLFREQHIGHPRHRLVGVGVAGVAHHFNLGPGALYEYVLGHTVAAVALLLVREVQPDTPVYELQRVAGHRYLAQPRPAQQALDIEIETVADDLEFNPGRPAVAAELAEKRIQLEAVDELHQFVLGDVHQCELRLGPLAGGDFAGHPAIVDFLHFVIAEVNQHLVPHVLGRHGPVEIQQELAPHPR